MYILFEYICTCRSHLQRGLRRGPAAAGLVGLWVRIPPEAWLLVFCDCCVLSGRFLCFGLITRPELSFRVWCVWVWSWSIDNEEARAHWGLLRHGKEMFIPNAVVLWNGQRESSNTLCFLIRCRIYVIVM